MKKWGNLFMSSSNLKLPSFRERLHGPVLVSDGALGTYLYEKGFSFDRSFDILNILQPDLVKGIHQEYISAGSELIETNTYTANRDRLERFNLGHKVREINIAGARIAREASGGNAYIAGSVGPIGKPLEPISPKSVPEAKDIFKEQIEALVEGGVDVILLETFSDMKELVLAIETTKEVCTLPIIAQKTFFEEGSILSGTLPIDVAGTLTELGVDVIGANCTVGPQRMLEIMKRMVQGLNKPLSAMPTAGMPELKDGRVHYHASPEYMAEYAKMMVEEGVFLIGGCCGTTPAHINAIAKTITGMHPGKKKMTVVEQVVVQTAPVPAKEAILDFSPFSKKIGKRFVFTVELDIPKGLDISSVMAGAVFLKESGVDAVNISDGARARLRMNPIVVAHILKEKIGMESILHYTCRDRNLIGLQSELFGAYALGLQNILAITGDPTNIGDYPTATSVFDVDSIGLVKILHNLNQGIDLAGNPIGEPTRFTICVAANPMAEDMEREICRLQRKVEEGANVIFTQPIFHIKYLEQLLERIHKFRIPIMVGILPLRSQRHAEFLHNEVPGIIIPDDIRARMSKISKEEGPKVGVEIAQELARQFRPLIEGLYFMPPFEKYAMAVEIMEVIRKKLKD